MNPALFFEPDGYLLTGPKLMGRQVAGNGFLRAAVLGRAPGPLPAYTPSSASAEAFRGAVAQIDPTAETTWIPGSRLDLLAQAGILYRPDQNLGPMARQRLRVGPAAYSLTGVTHTLSTPFTLDALAKTLVDPLMPWDALVCTSRAARAVVETVLEQQAAYQRWRTGQEVAIQSPLFPVIPLGVHSGDFAFTADDRAAARVRLGLAADEVAALFAGRLSVSGKTHPHAMFLALQCAAQTTGRKVVLVVAGQAATPGMDGLFRSGLTAFCPEVRPLFVDGADAAAYRGAWAGADLFISLADTIQETFGITPAEAMAAGLPAVVSDWNGYRDTVRDGIDGFRIATWAPPAGAGEAIARDFEAGALRYEQYLSRSNTAVTVDMGQLTARLTALVADEALRRRMGAAGRARVASDLDWSVVYRSYQALWAEQTAIRERANADPATARWLAQAPRSGADHAGPFDTFASYPTRHVGPRTLVTDISGVTPQAYRQLVAHELLALWPVHPQLADRLFGALTDGPMRVEDLAHDCELTFAQAAEVVARLAKIDLVSLSSATGDAADTE